MTYHVSNFITLFFERIDCFCICSIIQLNYNLKNGPQKSKRKEIREQSELATENN